MCTVLYIFMFMFAISAVIALCIFNMFLIKWLTLVVCLLLFLLMYCTVYC